MPRRLHVGLLRRARIHGRTDVADLLLAACEAAGDSEVAALLPYGSVTFVEPRLATFGPTLDAAGWARLARWHPALAAERLAGAARDAAAFDPRLARQARAVLPFLARSDPDRALDVLAALARLPPSCIDAAALPVLDAILRQALDAADLSHRSLAALQRLTVRAGFERWLPTQQAGFARTLEGLVDDPARDVPTVLHALAGLAALPDVPPRRLPGSRSGTPSPARGVLALRRARGLRFSPHRGAVRRVSPDIRPSEGDRMPMLVEGPLDPAARPPGVRAAGRAVTAVPADLTA